MSQKISNDELRKLESIRIATELARINNTSNACLLVKEAKIIYNFLREKKK
jgi:hypothetical protein